MTTDQPATASTKPNVLYFLVDNLGLGEISAYTGGALRGIATKRIDAFSALAQTEVSIGRAATRTG